jgi:hypothetical protein
MAILRNGVVDVFVLIQDVLTVVEIEEERFHFYEMLVKLWLCVWLQANGTSLRGNVASTALTWFDLSSTIMKCSTRPFDFIN